MAAPQLGRTQLEEKDRDDLAQIASALGIKGVAKADKAVLIEKILEETMAPEPKESAPRDSKPKTSTESIRTHIAGTGAVGGKLSLTQL